MYRHFSITADAFSDGLLNLNLFIHSLYVVLENSFFYIPISPPPPAERNIVVQ
jgi:hypothetical protein